MAKQPEYTRWYEMIRRCYNPKHRSFHNYGGRGITVCKRWHKHANFLADMGLCPPGLTLERINNNRGYSPANCKWATYKEQCANKRSHAWNKLTLKDARAIRADPRAYGAIAADYDVTRPMIGYIKQGKSFTGIGGPSITRPSGKTKLTPKQVRAIRADPRRPYRIIAADYDVSRHTIKAIILGITWRNA